MTVSFPIDSSHALVAYQASYVGGRWYGTWRCKNCRGICVQHKDGTQYVDNTMYEPCGKPPEGHNGQE